jgi:hypothetical protein
VLDYRLLKNRAGLLLIGDYASLRELNEIIHDINGRSPLIREEDGAFLGLAYDARKAYERQREIQLPPEGYDEIGVRYGVEILWPVLLVQQRMLRVSLGYLDHSRRHQAITYGTVPSSETAAADAVGMSERQRKTAVRVANVPEADFEEQVESDTPPTVTKLAQQGKRKAVELGPVKPFRV